MKRTAPHAVLGVITLVLVLGVLTSRSAASEECGTAAIADEFGLGPDNYIVYASQTYDEWAAANDITFWRYVPDASLAPNGAVDIEFTVSSSVVDAAPYWGDAAAVKLDLDTLAWELCDRIDNPQGVPTSDIAVLYDLFEVSDALPYPYGSTHFASPSNGGRNMLVDNRSRRYWESFPESYWIATGDSIESMVNLPAKVNHVDIVVAAGSDMLALGTNVPPNPQFPVPFATLEGFPSDRFEDPSDSLATYGLNGVVINEIPTARGNWQGYQILAHELGHLFHYMSLGWGSDLNNLHIEFTANVARRYVGAPIPAVPYGIQYEFDYTTPNIVRDSDRTLQGEYLTKFSYSVSGHWNERYQKSEQFWAYLMEHYFGADSGTVADDLVHAVFNNPVVTTITLPQELGGGTAENISASITLEHIRNRFADSEFDNATRYPYFQSVTGSPLSADERFAIAMHAFQVSLIANAPEISAAQFGFPDEYVPTGYWPLFQIRGPGDTFPNAKVTLPVVTVDAGDFGEQVELPDSLLVESDDTYMKMAANPWSTDAMVFEFDSDAQGVPTRLLVQGDGDPFSDSGSDYWTDVQASLVVYADTEDSWIHESGAKVVDVIQMDRIESGAGLAFVGTVPAGTTHAALVLTMAEMEFPDDVTEHPFWDASNNPPDFPAWEYSVSYTVAPGALELTGDATDLEMSDGLYQMLYVDANDDGRQDLILSTDEVGALARFYKAVDHPTLASMPQYAYQSTAIPSAVETTRGGHVADYDGDGDQDVVLAGIDDAFLLRNDTASGTISFSDASSEFPNRNKVRDSWTAMFADYDRDGDTDIYVGRASTTGSSTIGSALPDVLLERNSFGLLQDVTAAAQLDSANYVTSTSTAAWADVDGDGDLDLFVGDANYPTGSAASILYLQRRDPSAERQVFDATTPFSVDPNLNYNLALDAEWVDYDQDGNLDLVVAGTGYPSASPGSQIHWGDGTGAFPTATALPTAVGVAAADLNLDGRPELALAVEESDTCVVPGIWGRLESDAPRSLNDQTESYGLSTSRIGSAGYAQGIVVADVAGTGALGDGDPDLLLGRDTNASQEYFLENLAANDVQLKREWVRVKLVGLQNTVNEGVGLGSVVAASAEVAPSTVLTQSQFLGLPTSGAPSNELVFGLGSFGEGATLLVTWPDGYVQQRVLSQADLDTTVTIEDDHGPGIQMASPGVAPVLAPNQTVDWVFSWRTDFSTDPALDKVTVKRDGAKVCPALTQVELTPSSSNVSHEVVPVDGGGYLHRLTWHNRDCGAVCTYDFKVQSGTSTGSQSTPWDTFTISVCAN